MVDWQYPPNYLLECLETEMLENIGRIVNAVACMVFSEDFLGHPQTFQNVANIPFWNIAIMPFQNICNICFKEVSPVPTSQQAWRCRGGSSCLTTRRWWRAASPRRPSTEVDDEMMMFIVMVKDLEIQVIFHWLEMHYSNTVWMCNVGLLPTLKDIVKNEARLTMSKKTSGIVESMKTTVERMTTAIEVKAYSWNENRPD